MAKKKKAVPEGEPTSVTEPVVEKPKKGRKPATVTPDVSEDAFYDAMVKLGKEGAEVTPSNIRKELGGPAASIPYHTKLFATANKLEADGKICVCKREGKRTYYFKLAGFA